jgi:hypothetical protein
MAKHLEPVEGSGPEDKLSGIKIPAAIVTALHLLLSIFTAFVMFGSSSDAKLDKFASKEALTGEVEQRKADNQNMINAINQLRQDQNTQFDRIYKLLEMRK